MLENKINNIYNIVNAKKKKKKGNDFRIMTFTIKNSSLFLPAQEKLLSLFPIPCAGMGKKSPLFLNRQ